MIEFRKAYSQLSVGVDCSGDGMTKQSFGEQCDINVVMAKYVRTGLLEHVNERAAVFDDFSGFDFARSMNVVVKANEMFDNLPAEVRLRFSNDPAQFVEFCQNSENREEAVRLGLIPKPAQSVSEPVSPAQAGSEPVGQAGGASVAP